MIATYQPQPGCSADWPVWSTFKSISSNENQKQQVAVLPKLREKLRSIFFKEGNSFHAS
jgi:hypothetical protein